MRQVTGSNIIPPKKMVSIQLPLGGHSFSSEQAEALCNDAGIERAECTVLTPRTTLVPRECFAAEAAEQYLRIAGVPCRSDETVVTSDRTAQIVAVMAIDARCDLMLRERFGERLVYTSPLCGNQNWSEPTVWLYRTHDIIYIKVYKPILRLAEAVEVSSEADVLQLLQELEADYGVSACRIVCSGDGRERLRRRLSGYYSDVRCES